MTRSPAPARGPRADDAEAAAAKATSASGLPPPLIARVIHDAFSEDLGLAGDITTDATIPARATATAAINAREAGVICGLPLAEAAFRTLDPFMDIDVHHDDGSTVQAGATIVTLKGRARAVLTAERIALNFLGRLSGIASLTRAHVDAVAGTRAAIVDTRKTTPGLRAFEKYAVRTGGGMNHRVGLFDAVLIKDNHIAVAGGIRAAIEAARQRAGHMVKIEVEVDTLEQLREAMEHRVDAVLLDNMSLDELREAVAIVDGRALTEASGGVTLERVGAIAQTGVDLISSGALTHSAPNFDLGLDISIGEERGPIGFMAR